MQIVDILSLQTIQGVGNKSLISLIEFCRASEIDSLSDLALRDLSRVPTLKRVLAALQRFFAEGRHIRTRIQCEADLRQWESQGISFVEFGSPRYPRQLVDLNDPPAILVCRGNLELLSSPLAVAVVGTRENTRVGEAIAQRTVEHFARKGFCIISGLALGIDAIAHRAALENQGSTIAVVVDVINVSPSSNRDLASRILQGNGLLVSENLPGTKIVPALFAKRGRIQSGLSLAVFAIETSVDGGTMHAVNAANTLRRPVFVPDPVAAKYPDLGERTISGTQLLVRDGRASAYSRDSYIAIERELHDVASRFAAD